MLQKKAIICFQEIYQELKDLKTVLVTIELLEWFIYLILIDYQIYIFSINLQFIFIISNFNLYKYLFISKLFYYQSIFLYDLITNIQQNFTMSIDVVIESLLFCLVADEEMFLGRERFCEDYVLDYMNSVTKETQKKDLIAIAKKGQQDNDLDNEKLGINFKDLTNYINQKNQRKFKVQRQ
ncbi:SWIM zinc finger family protein, putative [Ichthyophthirius multifiliis]|uniref:SWIM zinc finger family protein, putative n=1 Tax=Ichthyophthirius multifiliis TaxID=5932 RepID=G0QKL1_ICHMU|nr:SWIM zinc finger family protein, putative [Ichthyophthirius multifiliis]EGR34243.1 SWIM zinc finger family protein, putative [Ichthyophthirius multifiliis]|eukprot:XP_004039547.1 SWIM zinc finger family protein, putative [Ichthyophthirius multifiliis]